jgi:tetratricopeptide (TPR) repeat protein
MKNDVQVRQARAFLLVAPGELLSARDRFQSLEADEASAAAAAQLAALHGELGEDDEAVVALLRAVERAPESASYRRRYFEALVRAKDWSTLAASSAEPGGEILGGGLHLYYGGLAAFELNERDRGIGLLRSLVSLSEAESVALAAAAALLYRTDAWQESEAASRAFLDREPEEPGLHHLLAMSLSRQQRESEALAHYRRAAELRRKDADLQFALFVSLCDLELVDELEDRMPRALREFREDLRFEQLAGQCLPQDDE